MFERLSRLWKGDTPLAEEYRRFVLMLNKAREMYLMIIHCFNTGEGLQDLEATVYNTDIEINKLERRIRKALVTHLAVNPGQQVAGALILMSVVKDAERLGDFCKNLYEAASYWCLSCNEMVYADRLNELKSYVSTVFDSTISAFEMEDGVLAAEIIQDEVKWNKRFDGFITEVANSDLRTREAVCTVLMVRTLKRLQAHLANIASSVVLPVHHIDHRPKHLRD
jgi:phosphate uptake regulator